MKKFIFDTDWWTDCDDCAALQILCSKHNKGEIELYGVVINAHTEYSVRSVDAFLNENGIKNLPIGIDEKADDFAGKPKYQEILAAYSDRIDYLDGVECYRRLLSSAEQKVDIIAVGFLNVIDELLKSKGDGYSPLNGYELVRDKVGKIWIMGGKWDEDGGCEHNFCNNTRSRIASSYVLENCPVPLVMSGWENGNDIISGRNLDRNSLIFKAFDAIGHGSGRSSWDPMVTLLAVSGDVEGEGYKEIFGKGSVEIETGKNHFTPDEKGKDCYVVMTKPSDFYADRIDEIISK